MAVTSKCLGAEGFASKIHLRSKEPNTDERCREWTLVSHTVNGDTVNCNW